ncbi:hypothetical protein [Streptomyces sp. CB03911]|uniref:hypothetical protein n=1 Tax=Streptomyces sp. CB03911 TaxID=1804758 RepID=UPI00093F7933|nr:hypothetical protein [Streptomyces sp. CB03911]OKI25120.1 hypothetical protein A6A07_31495 [Streptomyces sp. CB03911]
MSYDLAVWEGERPADDSAAVRCFADLYDRYMDTEEPAVPPVERIALRLRPPGTVAEDEDDTSPWSTGPLISEARGPLIYFPMRWSMAVEASAYAAEVASSMGLNCFDPQARQLRP